MGRDNRDRYTSALTGGPNLLDNAHYSKTSTEDNIVGGRSLYIRRQIVDCVHVRAALRRWVRSGYPYAGHPEILPKEVRDAVWCYCRNCSRLEGCRQFLQYERDGIENLNNGGHTGWLHLQTDKRYKNYYYVDSMEHYWRR